MKKKLIMFIVVFMLALASVSDAQIRNSISSGLNIVDTSIAAGDGILTGVLIITDGINAATVIIYDNTSATGTVLFKGTVPGAAMFGGATWEIPVKYRTGIYVDVSGTDASYIIYYSRG